MKKIFNLLVITLLLSSTVYAQKDGEPYLTKSLSKEKVANVLARTSGGSILVAGGNASEAHIEVYITSNNNNKMISNEEIKERLQEDYKMIIEVTGDKLTAVAEPKSSFTNWKQALNISFKIYVPSNVSTDLSTSGGGIELRDLSGTHNFSTSGGGLHLSKITGKTRGKTSGGSITVRDSKDDITLSTSGGGIHASNCSGALRLNTSGGRIELEDLNGEIEAETSGGPIRGANIRGSLYAHTSGGPIEFQKLACGLDASTKGLDLRLKGDKISTVGLANFNGDQEEDQITGKVNGGGIDVNVSTSGRLTFSMK